jgi:hypothetical protein
MNAITLNQRCSLTDLDWQVVEIARMDGPRSIKPDGGFIKLLKDFFGLPLARKLANERLEALRRFCVRAWYWDLIRSADMRVLTEAGYSVLDAFQIINHVAGTRGFTPSIQEQTR